MFKFLFNVLKAMGDQPISVTSTPIYNHVGNQFNNVELQIQDSIGNWRTCHVTQNNSQLIISGMHQLSNQFPGQRVRAVDSNGRIVDIL